jgi:hypothetical protein
MLALMKRNRITNIRPIDLRMLKYRNIKFTVAWTHCMNEKNGGDLLNLLLMKYGT